MTPSPYTIGADQKIETALKWMKEMKIRHLPVLKGDRLVGLVSERDMKIVEALEDIDPSLILVKDIMIPSPYTATLSTPLHKVVLCMADRKYGAVVVLNKNKVIGIFTVIDALKLLGDFLREK